MQHLKIVVSAALAVAALTSPASAERAKEIRVTFYDLNLSQPRDAERMLDRLTRAAERACGRGTGVVTLEVRHAIDACAAESLERAVARLDSPMVQRAFAATVQRPQG